MKTPWTPTRCQRCDRVTYVGLDLGGRCQRCRSAKPPRIPSTAGTSSTAGTPWRGLAVIRSGAPAAHERCASPAAPSQPETAGCCRLHGSPVAAPECPACLEQVTYPGQLCGVDDRHHRDAWHIRSGGQPWDDPEPSPLTTSAGTSATWYPRDPRRLRLDQGLCILAGCGEELASAGQLCLAHAATIPFTDGGRR